MPCRHTPLLAIISKWMHAVERLLRPSYAPPKLQPMNPSCHHIEVKLPSDARL